MANELSVDIVVNSDDALNNLKGVEKGINKLSNTATKDMQKVDNTFSVFKGTLGSILAVNFAGFLKEQVSDTVKAFKEFETGLIGVAKTTDLTGLEFKLFETGIENLTKTLPVASKELLEIAQAAGQLGVKGADNLLNFTETIAKLGRASDVSGNEAATALTRILNVTSESTDNIDELASVVVSLGNNFAASESEIIRVANEVARAGQQFGLSSSEAAAFGATLRAFGVRAEEAGSAVGKTFRAIQSAVEGGGKSLEQLSKITGLSGEELRKQFGENAVAVFQKFLVGLNEAQKSGKVLTNELAKLGLEGETIQKVLPTLSSNYTELSRAIELANKETKNATALNQEFARFAESTESKTQLLANAFEKLQRNIGEKFAPVIKAATPLLADFILQLAGEGESVFIRENRNIEALTQRLSQYKRTLEIISKEPALGRDLGETAESVQGKIDLLNKSLNELRAEAPKEELKRLEDQLKSLDEQAKLPFQFNFSGESIEQQKAKILEQIKNINAQIALENNQLVEMEKASQEEQNNAAREGLQNRVNILAEFKAAREEQATAEREVALAARQATADEDLQFLRDNLGAENAERELARIKQIEDEKRRNEELKKLNDKANQQSKASLLDLRKFENMTNQEKVQAQRDTLATISTLSQSSNSALFAIGKASSLTLAGINVAEGVTKALAAFPPPFNYAAAAAVGAAGAVQIARIASAKPPSAGNFADGGIIDGPSQAGDRLTANVNAGEVIFNRRQQENLFNAVNSGELGGGGGVVVNINGDFLSSDQSVDKLIDNINDAIEFRNRKLRA